MLWRSTAVAVLLLLLAHSTERVAGECHRLHSFDSALRSTAALPGLEDSLRMEDREAGVHRESGLDGGSAVRRRAQADHTACQKDMDAMDREGGSAAYVRMFMMSHCPFAARALQLLLPGLLNQQRHSAATRLRLEFIGTGSDDATFRSLHGPEEVRGDRLYLCLQDKADTTSFMRAVWCLSRAPTRVGERQQAEGCFGAAGLSQNKVKEIFDCAEDGDSASAPMLRESFAKAVRLQIGESPTVYLCRTLPSPRHFLVQC